MLLEVTFFLFFFLTPHEIILYVKLITQKNSTVEEKSKTKASDIKVTKISLMKNNSIDETEPQDDVLEIGNSETFDDLDFEPEDNKAGESVLFKSMTTKPLTN